MATGSKKKDQQVNSATQQAIAAAQPKSYSDPFGTFKKGTFTPNISEDQQAILNTADSQTRNALESIPQTFDTNDYFNNPYYDSVRGMYNRTIDAQKERDTNELNATLNARGQLGSSNEALQRYYMNKDYSDRYANADDQARQASADAFQQQYANAITGLNAAQAAKGNALEQIYIPAKLATNYQQSIAPLQQAQVAAYTNKANYYGNKPTFMDNFNKYVTAPLIGAGGQAVAAWLGRPIQAGA